MGSSRSVTRVPGQPIRQYAWTGAVREARKAKAATFRLLECILYVIPDFTQTKIKDTQISNPSQEKCCKSCRKPMQSRQREMAR